MMSVKDKKKHLFIGAVSQLEGHIFILILKKLFVLKMFYAIETQIIYSM